ncbi:flippase-like domain-containing protein [Beggiatoa alba]|nr:flippase-like domain-containing protein [Beggiatoa alba]
MNTQTPPQPSATHKKGLLKYIFGTLILLAFVVFVEYFIGWVKLLAPWKDLDTLPLITAVSLIFVTYGLRTLRIYDFFRAEMKHRFTLCLRLSLQHNMLNNLLPMRTGELSFPVLMSRYFSIPAVRSIPALLWFRLLDLHTLLVLALLVAGKDFLPLWAVAVSTVLWLSLPWLAFRLYRPWLKAIDHHQGKVWTLLRMILESLPQDHAKFWRSWMWTVLNWILKLTVFAWVLMLFSDTEFAAAWLGATAGDLTSVLPIHGIAGAGTFEAGVVAGLIPFGISAADALTAAINLHLFLLSCTVFSGILSRALPKKQL